MTPESPRRGLACRRAEETERGQKKSVDELPFAAVEDEAREQRNDVAALLVEAALAEPAQSAGSADPRPAPGLWPSGALRQACTGARSERGPREETKRASQPWPALAGRGTRAGGHAAPAMAPSRGRAGACPDRW